MGDTKSTLPSFSKTDLSLSKDIRFLSWTFFSTESATHFYTSFSSKMIRYSQQKQQIITIITRIV